MTEKNCLIEKYRPYKIDDVISQNEIINIFKNIVKTSEMPHLLLYGSSGIGKTSAILALCNELYGPVRFRENVLELNASDERGINIVRNKIISFSKLTLGTKDKNYPSPDFKIIILDEADAMTKEAQTALRKVMEDMTSITRFCFICNNITQIIEPINSRCVKLKFKNINKDEATDKLYAIAEKEDIQIKKKVLREIINIVGGDLRKAILLLQNIKYIDIPLTVESVYDVYKYMTFEHLKMYIDKILENNSMKNIIEVTKEIIAEGYIFNSIIKQIIQYVLQMDIEDIKKSEFLFEIGIVDKTTNMGGDEYINLLKMLNMIKNLYV